MYPFSGQDSDTVTFEKVRSFGVSEEIFIEYISHMEVDRQGRVYIGESTPNRKVIYVFDSEGKYVTTIGRSGKGPGEFLRITNMEIFDDKLYVFDASQNRISIFTLKNLSLLESVIFNRGDFKNFDNLESMREVGVVDIRRGPKYLVNFKPSQSLLKDNIKSAVYYYRDNTGTLIPGKILEVKEPHIFTAGRNSRILPFTTPFTRSTLTAFSDGGLILTSWSEDFLVKVYDEDGKYQRAFYYPHKKSDLSKSGIIKEIAGEERRNFLEDKELPETWPALHNMLIDDKNQIWVFTITESDTSYLGWILNLKGQLLADFKWSGKRSERHLNELDNMIIRNGNLYEIQKNGDTGQQIIVKYNINFKKR